MGLPLLSKGAGASGTSAFLPRQEDRLRSPSRTGSNPRRPGSPLTARAQRQDLQERATDQIKETTGNLKQTGIISDLIEAQQSLERSGVSMKQVVGICLLAGLTFGTVFQVTHNNGFLPKYDVWPFRVGPFLEAGTIPIVLAPIWVLYGYLYPLLDAYFDDPKSAYANETAKDLRFVALTWLSLAAMFILSDVMYLKDFPHWQCSAVLALAAGANWLVFDGTKTGAILGALLAVGAPLGEVFIVNVLGLWHYDRPDFFGVPHWAGWCYAAYAYGVGNFARWVVQNEKKKLR